MQHVNHEAGCVSELALDEWDAGELPPDESAQVAEHVAGCPHCRTRHETLLRERTEFLAAAPSFNAHAVHANARAKKSRVRQRFGLLVSSLTMLAAAALVVVWTGAPASEDTRSKGRPHVSFFVKRGGDVHRGRADERFQPGDSLRFLYSSEAARYFAMFNLDAQAATVYFPAGADGVKLPAGNDVPLEFSVELDEQLGREQVYALFCETPFKVEPLRAALLRDKRLTVGAGCNADVITLHKERGP